MSAVFVSSVIVGFESYRDAAARAIEEFGLRPVRSERQPARDIDPKRALTTLVRESDIFLLILGERYGAPDGAVSPVEDEYAAAVASGKPILVMVQTGVAYEPAQERFIATTSTGWDSGRYRARFANEDQLEKEIIRALRRYEQESRGAAVSPGVIEYARALAAAGVQGPGYGGRAGGGARVVIAPVSVEPVNEPWQLNDSAIGDALADSMRAEGSVSSLAGLELATTSEGVRLVEKGRFDTEAVRVFLNTRGALILEAPVGPDDRMWGSTVILPERLAERISQAAALAKKMWETLGASTIQQAVLLVAIPGAGSRSFGAPRGSSASMGGLGSLGDLVAPADPRPVSLSGLGDARSIERIVGEVRRVFADVGAVNDD